MSEARQPPRSAAPAGGTPVRHERPGRAFALAPAVVALGLVSLLTDLSSEMIYPLLPAFLTQVLGAGAIAIGLVEGVAEATSSLLKIVSGRMTDRSGRRRPLVLAGYGLSGLARPAIGLAFSWPMVLACRFADRVGKGLRTAPRDALIADWTPPARRGAAYGLHRGMDHAGAVLGPLVAAGLLALGLGYRQVFLLAMVPAAAVIAVILLLVREPGPGTSPTGDPADGHAGGHAGEHADGRADGHAGRIAASATAGPPRRWPWLLGAVFLGALGTPAEAFLLLLLTVAGIPPAQVALLWSLHNVLKFATTLGAGLLADRLPRLPLVAAGWTARAAFLAGLALAPTTAARVVVFVAYGAVAALTEPAERALVADLVRRTARGRGFGAYHAVVGFGALPAGLILGVVWDAHGAPAALGLASALVLGGALLLALAGRGQGTPAAADA